MDDNNETGCLNLNIAIVFDIFQLNWSKFHKITIDEFEYPYCRGLAGRCFLGHGVVLILLFFVNIASHQNACRRMLIKIIKA